MDRWRQPERIMANLEGLKNGKHIEKDKKTWLVAVHGLQRVRHN